MIKSAVTDIVCPTVTAEDPYGLLAQVFLLLEDCLGCCAAVLLEGFDQSCRGSLVGFAVSHGVQPCLCCVLERCTCFGKGLDVFCQILADLLLTDEHSESVLCVVFEQRVAPCGSLTFLVGAVRRCGCRAAPD